jgi:pimeloyl-ACP methyl ester carboxylesterase
MDTGIASLNEFWTIVNGRPLFYRANLEAAAAGAVPIVHIHGFGISGKYLVPTAERLAPLHPTIVPDLPGYGRSHNPERTLTIPQLAQTLATFLDEFDYERYILLGNSMGCLISLEFAHEFPDRVDRVVLVSPAGGPNNQPLSRALGQMALDGVRETLALLPVAVPDYVRFGPVNSLRLFAAMTKYPTIERAAELSIPILLVAGQRDPLVSHKRLDLFASMHPNITLVVQDRAAHAINFSHPKALSNLVTDWIQHDAVTVQPDDPAHTYVAQADAPES